MTLREGSPWQQQPELSRVQWSHYSRENSEASLPLRLKKKFVIESITRCVARKAPGAPRCNSLGKYGAWRLDLDLPPSSSTNRDLETNTWRAPETDSDRTRCYFVLPTWKSNSFASTADDDQGEGAVFFVSCVVVEVFGVLPAKSLEQSRHCADASQCIAYNTYLTTRLVPLGRLRCGY